MERRQFLGSLVAAAACAAPKDVPTRPAKVTKLFKSPDGHPNGLETSAEGLWIGEQVTDRACLVDWKGKVLRKVDTECSNCSGIAYGGGAGYRSMRHTKPADELSLLLPPGAMPASQ